MQGNGSDWVRKALTNPRAIMRALVIKVQFRAMSNKTRQICNHGATLVEDDTYIDAVMDGRTRYH
jgi:hypothetical protein